MRPEIEREGTAKAVAPEISGLVVDLTDDPAAWPTWWEAGSRVIAVTAIDRGYLPEGITALVGDRRDPVTVRRVCDQVAGQAVTAMVVHPDDLAALPYHARLGGRILVRREVGPETIYELWR